MLLNLYYPVISSDKSRIRNILLPLYRVKGAMFFEVFVVDIGGPLYLKDRRNTWVSIVWSKRRKVFRSCWYGYRRFIMLGRTTWICFIICAVDRGVHIEMIAHLPTNSYI